MKIPIKQITYGSDYTQPPHQINFELHKIKDTDQIRLELIYQNQRIALDLTRAALEDALKSFS